jgi:hypothetical protein
MADDFSSVELQETTNTRRKTTMCFVIKEEIFVISNRWSFIF